MAGYPESAHIPNGGILEDASWRADFDFARLSTVKRKEPSFNEEQLTLPHAGRSPFPLHGSSSGPLSPTGEFHKDNYSQVDHLSSPNSSQVEGGHYEHDEQLSGVYAIASPCLAENRPLTDRLTATINSEVALTKAIKALEYSKTLSTKSPEQPNSIPNTHTDTTSLVRSPSLAREQLTGLMLKSYAERKSFQRRLIQLDLETVIMYAQFFLNLTAKDSSLLTRVLPTRFDNFRGAWDDGRRMAPIRDGSPNVQPTDEKIAECNESEPTIESATRLSSGNSRPTIDYESSRVDFPGVNFLDLEELAVVERAKNIEREAVEEIPAYISQPCDTVDSSQAAKFEGVTETQSQASLNPCAASSVGSCDKGGYKISVNNFVKNKCDDGQTDAEGFTETANQENSAAAEEGIGGKVMSALNLLESVCKVYANRLCEIMKLPVGMPDNKCERDPSQAAEPISEEAKRVSPSADTFRDINEQGVVENDSTTCENSIEENLCHNFEDAEASYHKAAVKVDKIDADIGGHPAVVQQANSVAAGEQENTELEAHACKGKAAVPKKHTFCSIFSSLHHYRHDGVQSLFNGTFLTPKHNIASTICNSALIGINDSTSPVTTTATASTPIIIYEDSLAAYRAKTEAMSKVGSFAEKDNPRGRDKCRPSHGEDCTRRRSRSRSVWSKIFHRNNACKRGKDAAETDVNAATALQTESKGDRKYKGESNGVYFEEQKMSICTEPGEKVEKQVCAEPPKVSGSLVDICIDAADSRRSCSMGIDTSVLYSGTEVLYKYNSKDGKKRSLYFWVQDGRLHWNSKKINLPKPSVINTSGSDHIPVDVSTPKLEISKASTLVTPAPHLPPTSCRVRARNMATDDTVNHSSRSRSTGRLPNVFRGMLGKRGTDSNTDCNFAKTTNSSSGSSSVFTRSNHFIELSSCRGIVHSYNYDIIKKGGGLNDNQVQNIMLIVTTERQLHIQATCTQQFYNWFLGLEELIFSFSCVLYKAPVHMRMDRSRLAFRRAKIIMKHRKPSSNAHQLVLRQ